MNEMEISASPDGVQNGAWVLEAKPYREKVAWFAMAILSAGAISGCTVIVTDARNDRAYYPRQPVTYYSDYRRSVEIVPVQRVETRTIYIAPQKPSHQGGGHSHHHK